MKLLKSAPWLSRMLGRPKKRVLLVSHELSLSGAPWSLFLLGKGLKKHGFDVVVVAHNDGPMRTVYEQEGIPLVVDPFDSAHPAPVQVDPSQFDVCIANTIVSVTWIRKAPPGTPIIWSIREIDLAAFTKHLQLTQEDFYTVSVVVFVSRATRQIYEDAGITGDFRTIHNGIDFAEIQTYRRHVNRTKLRLQHGFSPNDKLVLTTGSFHVIKGQLDVVKTAKLLRASNRLMGAKFLLVGDADAAGTYEKCVLEMIAQEDLSSTVLRFPSTDDVYKYFVMADIYLCPSHIESFSRTVLEAASFGLPVVSTNVFGIPEVVRHGQEARLVAAEDTQAMANELSSILSHPSEGERLGRAGRSRAKREFQQSRCVRAYIKIIDELISQ